VKVLGRELDRADSIHRTAMACEDDRDQLGVHSREERPGEDCSLVFVHTKELHDSAKIGQDCVGNRSDGGLLEGIHAISFLVVIRHKTLREWCLQRRKHL
jgi:hypothetical protein